jgi:uncharacterized protein YkwD
MKEWLGKVFWLVANTVSIILLIMLFQDYRNPPVLIVAGVTSTQTTVVDDSVMGRVNKYRLDSNLPAMATSSTLTALANARADDMVSRQYFAHTNPDKLTFSQQFPAGSIIPEHSCENLALSFTEDPVQVVRDWQNSAGHNRCMIDPLMKNAGYATREYGISYDANNQPRMHYLVVAIHGS